MHVTMRSRGFGVVIAAVVGIVTVTAFPTAASASTKTSHIQIKALGTLPVTCARPASSANGALVTGQPCLNKSNWDLKELYPNDPRDRVGTIVDKVSHLCMDTSYGQTAPYTPIVIGHCTGSLTQQWALWAMPDGSWMIANLSAGLCMTGNTQLYLYGCDPNFQAQKFDVQFFSS